MGKIRDIHELELEIEKTKLQLERLEMRIDQNFTDLRSNYWMMAINTLLGTERKEKIFSFFEKIASKVLEKFS